MTLEQRIKILLGEKDFVIAALQMQLEEAQNKPKEPKEDKTAE